VAQLVRGVIRVPLGVRRRARAVMPDVNHVWSRADAVPADCDSVRSTNRSVTGAVKYVGSHR